MGWHLTTVNIPADAGAVSCHSFTVHPWSENSDDNGHLSPVNAVSVISNKLSALAGGVVVMLVTAGSLSDFISRITDLAAVLPMPQIKRMQRSAASQAGNDAGRMQIPPPYSDAQAAGSLTFSTLQAAATAGRMAAAMKTKGAGGAQGLKDSLASFRQQREKLAAAAVKQVAAMSGRQAQVWAFVGDDAASSREAVLLDVPYPHNGWSVAVVFVGEVAAVKNWLASQREEADDGE